MTIKVEPINPDQPNFAARVSGLDLAAGVSSAVALEVEAAIDRFGVLVIHDQDITDDQQYAFSRHFGPMERATGDFIRESDRRLPMSLNDISNLDRRGRVLARDDKVRLFGLGNRLWHSDSSFKSIPAKYSLLSARQIPALGGNTEFADMRAAWDALSEAKRARCRELVCWHSQRFSRGLLGFTDWDETDSDKFRPVPQRLVRRHPGTGRLSLYLSAHAGEIEGWPTPEARVWMNDLIEHSTRPRFVYAHEWRELDLVMWDNQVTMHRAREYDHTQVRDMRRTTVAGTCSTMDQPIEP